MKRLFGVVGLLLLLVLRVHADGADEQYVRIYNLIQQGDSFGANQSADALTKYTEAQTSLRQFQKINPGWNERVVTFRLNYLASKITILSAALSSSTNAPVAIAPTATPVPTPTPTVIPPPTTLETPTLAPAAPVAPVVVAPPQVSPFAELQSQIAELQNQLQRVQNDKLLVEAKLREALAARPA